MQAINILLIEDNEDDALLLLNELRYGGFIINHKLRVQTEKHLRDALNNEHWDIIISDYTMPGFDGLQALSIVRQSGKDIPFILISGMIGEETAVAALKAGANDYLLKDRLSRLPKAIQKELDEALQRNQLKETQIELAKAKASADLANQRKSQVLAFVAHEFKNPLQAITLFSDLMKDQVYGPLNERQTGCIENIHTATQHLKNLVSDILDIAAIEAGKIRLNPVDFDLLHLLENVITLTQGMASQQNIQIKMTSVQNTLIINGDERRLKQVFINLVSNAIKYSPNNTLVSLNIQVFENECSVSVVDQGIGMAELELEQLFKEFYRVENRRSAHVEGVGLGLALTKALVELHQGKIEVFSILGKGSEFKVLLPLRKAPTHPEQALIDF